MAAFVAVNILISSDNFRQSYNKYIYPPSEIHDAELLYNLRRLNRIEVDKPTASL